MSKNEQNAMPFIDRLLIRRFLHDDNLRQVLSVCMRFKWISLFMIFIRINAPDEGYNRDIRKRTEVVMCVYSFKHVPLSLRNKF